MNDQQRASLYEISEKMRGSEQSRYRYSPEKERSNKCLVQTQTTGEERVLGQLSRVGKNYVQ